MVVRALDLSPEDLHDPPRSEIEVAADVLARLMGKRLIRGDDAALELIEREVGVPAQAVKEAMARQGNGDYVAPRRATDCLATPAPGFSPLENHRRPEPRSEKSRRQRSTPAFKKKNPTAGTRVCSDCERERPLIHFGIKSRNKDGTPHYHYRCLECRTEAARPSYLKVSERQALGSLIEFILTEDQQCACPYCPEPLEEGQRVAGVAVIAHAACLHRLIDAPRPEEEP